MSITESTCWTVIRAAAAGSPADREALAHRYLGVVRAYLAARWRRLGLRNDLDDATQNVFVECFRQGVTMADHRPDHKYRVIDALDFPIFERNWGADEELSANFGRYPALSTARADAAGFRHDGNARALVRSALA